MIPHVIVASGHVAVCLDCTWVTRFLKEALYEWKKIFLLSFEVMFLPRERWLVFQNLTTLILKISTTFSTLLEDFGIIHLELA
jgi:hypothetical protein